MLFLIVHVQHFIFISFRAFINKEWKILRKTSPCVNYKVNQGEESISRVVLTIIIDMSVLIYCGVPCNVANYYMLINHCTCYPIRLGFITPCRAKVRLINNVQLISGWLIELQHSRTCRLRVRTGDHFTSRRVKNGRTVRRKFDSSLWK